MSEKSTNPDQKTPDLKILEIYFADFKEFVRKSSKSKEKKFEKDFDNYLENNQKNLTTDEKEVYYKIISGETTLGLIIGRNITSLFKILEKTVENEVINENYNSSISYILTASPEDIFESANNLADPFLINPVIKKYLIAQLQEFIRTKETEKQNEPHSLPVNVATTLATNITNTDYDPNPINTPKIGSVGVNLGRDNLKQFKPSPEAIALQVEIDNLSQSGFEWYDKNNKTRDDNYLVQKQAEEKKLEADRLEAQRIEAEKIAKEKARLEEIAQLKKRLAELQGESPEQSPSNKLPEIVPAQETKLKIDFEKTYMELFTKFERTLGETSIDLYDFTKFVVDAMNEGNEAKLEFNKYNDWLKIRKEGFVYRGDFKGEQLIQRLENLGVSIFKERKEMKKDPLIINFTKIKDLFNWVRNSINNPQSLQIPKSQNEIIQPSTEIQKPKRMSEYDIVETKESLLDNEVLVVAKDIYKALGEIVAKKLGLELSSNIFVELMNLVHKNKNRNNERIIHNNYITAWSQSLNISVEKANNIIKFLYPIMTGKSCENVLTPNGQPHKEMFNEIKDTLDRIEGQFSSLCLDRNPKTESTFDYLESQSILVEKYGYTTTSEPVYIFAHPVIARIRKS